MKKLSLSILVILFFALVVSLPCSANSVNTIDNSLSVVAYYSDMLPALASDLVAGYYRRVWVPGHWTWRHGHRHWVPGHYRSVWVPGGRHWVPGYYRSVWVPGRWVWRHGHRHWVPGHYRRYWVPGHYVYR